MRRKFPSLLTGAAIVAMGIGLWITRQQSTDDKVTAAATVPEAIQSATSHVTDLDTGQRMVLEGFINRLPEPLNVRTESALVPEEWEEPLFGILMNEEQSMNERNARLLELATGPAKDVPAVQEECLMHLLFGIPDSNASQFLAVTTNSAIPLQMRVEFLKEALGMRPTELGEWLSQQLSNHYEPGISSIARLYLL